MVMYHVTLTDLATAISILMVLSFVSYRFYNTIFFLFIFSGKTSSKDFEISLPIKVNRLTIQYNAQLWALFKAVQ